MPDLPRPLSGRLAAFLRRLFGPEDTAPPPADAVAQAAASLLAEITRVDHEVKDTDVGAARDALQQLFALPPDKAEALLAHAARPENRHTSYHPLVSLLNRHLTHEQKVRLVESMWRVAHADRDVHMYEDHLVRKISELLYLSHTDFITAKHRARG
jgi:uncharacterized tellurite resistance protein B-like protein